MKRLLEKFAIDRRQFKALLRLAWRLDMRSSKLGFGLSRKGKKPLFIFLFAIAFYFFFGFVFAVTCYKIQDTFLAATLITGIIMLMMSAIMLIEYNAIIIAPDDYSVLGYMPVSSRTYFLSKLLNLLFYTLTFTLILGGPTALVLSMRHGFSIFKLFTAFAAILGAGLFVTLLIASLYSLLLKLISPARMKRLLSYLQFALALFIYLGYIVIPQLLAQYTAGLQIEQTGWWLFSPTSWFSAFVLLGQGRFGLFELSGAFLATASLGFLFYFAAARLSLSYAQKLASFETTSESTKEKSPASAVQKNGFLFTHTPAEIRVVAKLLRGQFRHDLRFRFSVLGMLPILIVYFYLGLQQGTFSDPFVTSSANLQDFGIFFFAILMMPMIMKKNIETSSAFAASWIFYTAPTEPAKLVLAARNLLFALFSLPGLMLIFLIFFFYFANLMHAFLHTLTLFLLSFLILQLIYFINPKLPFSEPKTRSAQSKSNMIIFLFLPAGGLLLLHLVTTNFYFRQSRLMLFYIAILAAIFLIEKLTRLRIRQRLQRLNFELARE